MSFKANPPDHTTTFLTVLREQGVDTNLRLAENPFDLRDVLGEKVSEVLMSGRIAVLRTLFPHQLESFLAFVRKNQFLPVHQMILLESLLKMRDASLLEEQKINEFVTIIRAKILEIYSVGTQEIEIVHASTIPEPVTELDSPPDPEDFEHRLLSHEEIIQRFHAMDYSIEEILDQWRHFYIDSGFALHYWRVTGQPYNLFLPSMTQGAMESLEQAVEAKRFPFIIIDDARLNDIEMLEIFKENTQAKFPLQIKNTFHALPSELRSMKAKCFAREGRDNGQNKGNFSGILGETFGANGLDDYGVRYVGFNPNCFNLYNDERGYAPLQRVSHVRNRSLMNLGTFVRTCAFLQAQYPKLYQRFTGDECEGTNALEFALNNFAADGEYVVATPHQGLIYLHLEENPILRHEGQTSVPIFQSDAR